MATLGATEHDVMLMVEACKKGTQIKAAGSKKSDHITTDEKNSERAGLEPPLLREFLMNAGNYSPSSTFRS